MSALAERVEVAELCALFAGDEHSAPFPTVGLVLAICAQLRPESVSVLRERIYGPWPADMIPHRARCAIAVGYADWVTSGRPD